MLESIVTISLITVIMAALGTFFVTVVSSTGQQRARAAAAQIADSSVSALRAKHASDLVAGHDSASVSSQFGAALTTVQPWNNAVTQAIDPSASAGTGSSAFVPTTGQTTVLNNVTYTTLTYLGWCWIPTDGSSTTCTSASMPTGWTNTSTAQFTSATKYLRAVVAVTWKDKHCANSACSYVTSTLLNTTDDPTFNLNQTPPAVPVVTNPGDQTAAVGDSVSVQLKVNDFTGVPPFTWVVSAGTLPAGLSINSAGLISGAPTAQGITSGLIVTVTDAFLRHDDSASFKWTILPQLKIGQLVDRGDNVGVPMSIPPSASLSATGGTGTGYTWTASGLPLGVSLSPAGVLSGTPTTFDTYTPTVTVTDSSGTRSASGTFTWTITYPPLAPVTPSAQVDTLNTPVSGLQLATNGGSGSFSYTLQSGLPAGVTMSPSGLFSGSPTAIGTTTVKVLARDTVQNVSASAPVTFTWTIVAKPTVTAPGTITTTLGASPTGPALVTSCPNSPCSYTLNNGPAGMTISGSGVFGGSVGGTATTYSTATVTVTDSDGASATTAAFSIVVNPAPTLTNPGTQTDKPSTPDSLALSGLAAGGTGTYTYSAAGLPSWLSLNAATGLISGTSPSTTSSTTVTVRVTDAAGVSVSATFKWNVSTLAVVAVPTQNSAVGTVYTTANGPSSNGLASGGTSPYTYTATGLPTGLSMSSSGVVTGTASTAGTYSVVVTVTDSIGSQVAATPFTWNVGTPPTITPSSGSAWPITTSRSSTPSQRFAYTCSSVPCTVTVSGLPSGVGISSSTPNTSANTATSVVTSTGSGSVYLNGKVSSTATRTTYSVTVKITDNFGLTDTESGSWKVS